MALAFTVDVSGSPAGNDIEAATFAVEAYNEANGTTLATSPTATLAASYETVLAAALVAAHASYGKTAADNSLESQARQLWRDASDAERAAAITALGG